jgi:hypothetical protein
MSKRKRHKREKEERNNSNNMNSAPFGINPLQLMNMLGSNIDMGQIGNMLSSMKMDGLDLNSVNLGQNNNNNMDNSSSMNNNMGFDLGSLQNMLNNLGLSNNSGLNQFNNDDLNINDKKDDLEVNYEDENLEMLKAIKIIVDPNKTEFIDRIITAYKNGDIK